MSHTPQRKDDNPGQRSARVIATAAIALLVSIDTYADDICPPPPFPPAPAVYRSVGGLCGHVTTGSVEEFRAAGEDEYNNEPLSTGYTLRQLFGALTLDYEITDSNGGVVIWWQSERNGAYACITALQKPESSCRPPGRNLGAKQCLAAGGTTLGNPLDASTGNKYQQEVDYRTGGPFPLAFRRHYNSAGYGSGSIGHRWSHSFQRHIVRQTATIAQLERDDGEIIYLDQCPSGWCSPPDVAGRLTEQTNGSGGTVGWVYVDENDVTETYDGGGRLQSERSRAGIEHVLSYDGSGRLSTIRDSFGHELDLAYDSAGRVQQLILPDTDNVVYGYDAAGNLSTATYPGAETRTYLYDEPGFVAPGADTGMLTGIEDESGQRFATFQYNGQSQVIDELHGSGADHRQITYNPDGTTTVLDAAGTSRTYSWQTLADVNHIASLSGPVCSTCDVALPHPNCYQRERFLHHECYRQPLGSKRGLARKSFDDALYTSSCAADYGGRPVTSSMRHPVTKLLEATRGVRLPLSPRH